MPQFYINFTSSETRRIVLPEAETTRSHLYSSVHNIGTWRTGGQTESLSQRDRAAWCVIVFTSSRLELRDNIYGHYRSIFNHCDIIGLKICRIPRKKRKIRVLRRSRSFKVTEVGTNRKPICDFLLVINSNWHPISYRFGVIAAYCSNFTPMRSL